MICVPTMLRISVVLPQPDGPSRPVIVPRAICTEMFVQRDPLTADDPQVLDVDGRLDTPLRSNSSLDEVIMR